MTRKSRPRIGSTFENWLDETGIREETTAAALKSLIATRVAEMMRKQSITRTAMAERMRTSVAQLDRLLDPDNGGVTLETLMRAAKVIGHELRVRLT